MDWCSVYLAPQGLPKYIYLSPSLIFPTTYNGIRTKNRPVWITLGAAPIRWMGPIRNPRWEQKRTKGYVIVSNWKRALGKVFFFPTLIFRSSHSFITLSSSALYFFSCALYNLSHLYNPLYHFRDVFLCFQILFITKRCSLNVLNMILETPNFKVTNII